MEGGNVGFEVLSRCERICRNGLTSSCEQAQEKRAEQESERRSHFKFGAGKKLTGLERGA